MYTNQVRSEEGRRLVSPLLPQVYQLAAMGFSPGSTKQKAKLV